MKKLIRLLLLISLSISIYGNSNEDYIKLPVPVFLNGNYYIDNFVFLNPANEVYVYDSLINDVFRTYTGTNLIDNLSNSPISISFFDSSKIKIDFSQEELILNITIDISLKKVEPIPLLRRDMDKGNIVKPSPFSGYLNIFSDQGFKSGIFFGEYTFQNILNYNDWVLETVANMDLVNYFDLPDISLKKEFNYFDGTLGSFNNSKSGFQRSGKYHGFEIRSKNLLARSDTLFFSLSQESYIDINLNGNSIKTLSLPEGNYSLTDLPYYNGINLVELESHENPTDSLNSVFPLNSSTINKGAQDFFYSVGFPHWDPTGFLLTASHSYGLTEYLTLNGNIQTTDKYSLFGLSGFMGTNFGNLYFLNGYNLDYENQLKHGYKGSISYIWNHNIRRELPVVYLKLEYETNNYNYIPDRSNTMFELAGSISQNFIKTFSGSFNTRYRYKYSGDQRLKSSISLNNSFGRNLKVLLAMETDLLNMSLDDSFISLTFNYSDMDKNYSANYSHNFIQESQNLDIHKSMLNRDLVFQMNIDSDHLYNGDNFSLSQSAKYNGDRSISSLQSDIVIGENIWDYNISLSHNFSLAFTSGHFGITRPISDSFLFVIPQESIIGKGIGINHNGKEFLSRSDIFGPPLHPDLGSSFFTDINVELLDPEDSNFITNNMFYINPTYKSGTVIYVGEKKEIVLTGTIHNLGRPLSLKVGRIEGSGKSIEFFTDESGFFMIYGLESGIYKIKIKGFKNYEVKVVTDSETRILETIIELEEEDE